MSLMNNYQIIYQNDSAGRLDKFLLEFFSKLNGVACTRSYLQRLIKNGCVTVNSKRCLKPAYLLHSGDRIVVECDFSSNSITQAEWHPELKIVYQDNYLAVVNKPAGLVVHPGAGTMDNTLLNMIAGIIEEDPESFPDSSRPGIVHRLDKGTTGLMVVAKTALSHAALSSQFEKRTIERSYLGLVYSTPRSKRTIDSVDTGKISEPLGRDPTDPRRIKVMQSGQGKRATTNWQVVERFTYGSLLKFKLETGRTHQIRVHMAHIDTPLIGDPLYGDWRNLPGPLLRAAESFGRQALHAYKLTFLHPTTGKKLSFHCDAPDDMQKLVERFRRYGSGV
ncbi:MAG: RluA family pseudouridine synthase [Candidatus Dadabacteria bacterium]|nr:MAG: RluA family pseudouridine synthase [Candidatus Dadabacteria bacterium]